MTQCLFCRVVADDLPSTVVHETPRTLAIRDLSPAAPTHVLVLPKDHYDDIAALAAADLSYVGEVFEAASEVARREGLTGGHRMITNTGRDSGQTVPHLHVHVLGGRPLGTLVG